MRTPVNKSKRKQIVGIYYDLFDVLCDAVKSGGFVRQRPLFRRSKQTAEVYAKGGGLVVIFGSYKVEAKKRLGHLFPQLIQNDFERHLRDVMKEIDAVISALRPIGGIRLVFQGGGDLVLPDWFMEWASKNGIGIFIINPENLLEQCERIISFGWYCVESLGKD